MTPLSAFLLARIAEDEAVARAVAADNFDAGAIGVGDDPWPSERAFVERLTPARMLAECEAKRRIVELHTADHECTAPGDGYAGVFAADGTMPVICPTMLALALPYADRPGYREEWRP